MSFLDNYTEGQIKELVKNSKSTTELLMKLGSNINSGQNLIMLKQYAKDHNIDLSHFRKKHYWKDEDIFIENSTVTRKVMRERFLKGNYSLYKCAICGLGAFWNGKELSLTLDHINGNNRDNRLENLRWICPNCDRQLPTYCGNNKKRSEEYKAKKEIKYCIECGEPLSYDGKTNYCWNCWKKISIEKKKEIAPKIYSSRTNLKKYKDLIITNSIICPECGNKKAKKAALCRMCRTKHNKEEYIKLKEEKYGITKNKIKELLETKTLSEIGQIYNVYTTTVIKWCKAYDLQTSDKVNN